VENKIIHAHKVLVFNRCEYLRKINLFQSRFGNQYHHHKITGVKFSVFMSLLHYLYTDHLKVPPHLVGDLRNLALKYGLDRLARMCERNVVHEGAKFSIPESIFASDMQQAINSKEYSDVIFAVQEEKVFAHKVLLIARCHYFERLFESDFKEREQKVFELDQSISMLPLLAILSYIYQGDESVITPDNCIDLLMAADRLMMDDFKQLVESYIENSVDLDNVALLFEISDRFGAYRLKRLCIEMICESNKDNWVHVFNSRGFSEMALSSPHLLREIDYRASKNNLVKVGEVFRQQLMVE